MLYLINWQEKTFDRVLVEWIIKVLNILKKFPVKIKFGKVAD